jgi:RNA polymerase sigma factor (sigma-70 family)
MNIKEQEDIQLIQNILKGNKIAETNFFNKYKKIITSYLKHKYPKATDIEDCVSEILIKIFYSLDKYDPEKISVRKWALVIAKHYMIDRWRCGTITFTSSVEYQGAFNSSFDSVFTVNNTGYSPPNSGNITITAGDISIGAGDISIGASNPTFTTNNANMAFVANSYTVSCNIAAFENCNSINHISNQLSPVDYRLLDMKYIQGYEYCEIGKEFNLTSNTVSNRVNYLKTKLKKNNLDLVYE